KLDPRSDIFSLGVVGWELLTGLSPWGSGTPRQILARRIESLPPSVRELRPDTPTWLADAIDRALRAAPEERWQSADEMASALETQRRGARFGAWRRGRKPTPRTSTASAALAGATAASSMDTVRWERAVPPLPAPEPEAGQQQADVVIPRRRRGRRLLMSAIGIVCIGAAGALALVQQGDLFTAPRTDTVEPDVADRAPVEEVPMVAPPATSIVPLPESTVTGVDSTFLIAGQLVSADSSLLAAGTDSGTQPPADRSFENPAAQQIPLATERNTRVQLQPRPTPEPSQPSRPETLAAATPLAGVVGASSTTVRQTPAAGDSVTAPVTPAPRPPVTTREADATLGAASATFAGAARTVAGGQHSCLLDRDGAAWCWGANTLGQLGTTGARSSEPERVAGNLQFTTLAVGRAHSCGLTSGREAWCWGANDRGQIGDGSRVARSSPSRLSLGSRGITIGVGANHACALDASGAAWCWGANDRGQAGSGSFGSDVLTPRRVSGGHRFRSLSVGWDHACALDAEGRAWCWGSNDDGRLGDGSVSDHGAPVLVDSEKRFTAISAGGAHSCGVTGDGEGYCWGRNATGQLGDGTVAT